MLSHVCNFSIFIVFLPTVPSESKSRGFTVYVHVSPLQCLTIYYKVNQQKVKMEVVPVYAMKANGGVDINLH
jgi:hypothetical protein